MPGYHRLEIPRGSHLYQCTKTYALDFQKHTYRWRLVGNAEQVKTSRQQEQILQVLRQENGPLSPKSISDLTGLRGDSVKRNLGELVQKGSVTKPGRGRYIFRNSGR